MKIYHTRILTVGVVKSPLSLEQPISGLFRWTKLTCANKQLKNLPMLPFILLMLLVVLVPWLKVDPIGVFLVSATGVFQFLLSPVRIVVSLYLMMQRLIKQSNSLKTVAQMPGLHKIRKTT